MKTPVAVVVGGAGGIGAAICRTLGSAGFRVAVGYNSSGESARALAEALPGDGNIALFAPVKDSAALAAAAARVADVMGGCDVVVNCAGTTRFVSHGDLDALDDDLINEILAVNVRGAFAVVRAWRPILERSTYAGGAIVVNMSSIAAVSAMGSNVVYCASKAALDNMTRSLARALAPKIRVVSISPGLVDTDFVLSLDPAWRETQVARTPLGRLTTPDEVARGTLAIIRDLPFTTGAVIPVDGGRPLS